MVCISTCGVLAVALHTQNIFLLQRHSCCVWGLRRCSGFCRFRSNCFAKFERCDGICWHGRATAHFGKRSMRTTETEILESVRLQKRCQAQFWIRTCCDEIKQCFCMEALEVLGRVSNTLWQITTKTGCSVSCFRFKVPGFRKCRHIPSHGVCVCPLELSTNPQLRCHQQ